MSANAATRACACGESALKKAFPSRPLPQIVKDCQAGSERTRSSKRRARVAAGGRAGCREMGRLAAFSARHPPRRSARGVDHVCDVAE